jgi:hypothetical protein
MRLINPHPWHAAWTMGLEKDGREAAVVVVKATYVLPASGQDARLADEQLPLVRADEFTGAPGVTAPRLETDFAHRKPACDVLLLGSACAPPGHRAIRLEVGLRVGALHKRLVVVGNRTWRRQVVGYRSTAPEPFERVPISYDVAYGGSAEPGIQPAFSHAANPVGRGYWPAGSDAHSRPLPNTEQLGVPVEDCAASYVPMAFSPVGRSWLPRRMYAGTYDEAWAQNRAPLWPEDFDDRYFQAAPADQIIEYPRGGSEVHLQNLTPDGQRTFRLPSLRMPVTFVPHRGRDVVREANIDTIVFDTDADRFTLTWRVHLPLGRSIFDVKEALVGEMPASWHRARRFPGKPYFHSLSELVASRRQREVAE